MGDHGEGGEETEMKIRITELKVLATRAGVEMKRNFYTGRYEVQWPWAKYANNYDLSNYCVRQGVYYTLLGLIAEREGLLP